MSSPMTGIGCLVCMYHISLFLCLVPLRVKESNDHKPVVVMKLLQDLTEFTYLQ
jgi:hypothetical protein